jgi:hypothetical protein
LVPSQAVGSRRAVVGRALLETIGAVVGEAALRVVGV